MLLAACASAAAAPVGVALSAGALGEAQPASENTTPVTAAWTAPNTSPQPVTPPHDAAPVAASRAAACSSWHNATA